MTCPRVLATAALALLLAGCGYFNSMYNAQRRFRDAQSAAARGDDAAARLAYGEVIEKAARSYRSRPDGRWADDALFLIGRAHFSLADYDAAHAAMSHLLARSPDPTLRADAYAVRGAAELALGRSLAAAASLDSAAALAPSADLRGFLHLWRARAAFSADDTVFAWQELIAASADDAVALDARFEAAARAIALADSARVRPAFDALLQHAAAAPLADSVIALARASSDRFGPTFTHEALEPVLRSRWPADGRNALALERARHAAHAADTAAALAETQRLLEAAGGAVADDARDLSARVLLAGLEEPAELDAVRERLLPAAAHDGARHLLRMLATLDVLLERAADPLQRIARFAAAEIARDSLGAPLLARRLFLDYATAAADEPWTGKALLAALQLSPAGVRADSIRKRMAHHPHDLYLRAVAGATDEAAFTLAEERLARELIAVRHDAAQLAERALLALDTLRRRSP